MGVVCDAAVPPLLVGWGALNKRMNHEEHEGHEENQGRVFIGEAAFVLLMSFVVGNL